MSARQTEIVDWESLEAGAIILLGNTRAEWRVCESEPTDSTEEWFNVRLAPNWIPDAEPGKQRRINRTARFEVICA